MTAESGSSPLPDLDEATHRLRDLLRSLGRSGELAWVFREDLYSPRPGSWVARGAPPAENAGLVRSYFDSRRAMGAIELRGVCQLDERSAVCVWCPYDLPGGVQGWTVGLKLSCTRPWASAELVPNAFLWWLHRRRPAYRRFQRFGLGIPLRSEVGHLPEGGAAGVGA